MPSCCTTTFVKLVLNRAQRLQFDAVHLVPEELRGQLLDFAIAKQPME